MLSKLGCLEIGPMANCMKLLQYNNVSKHKSIMLTRMRLKLFFVVSFAKQKINQMFAQARLNFIIANCLAQNTLAELRGVTRQHTINCNLFNYLIFFGLT